MTQYTNSVALSTSAFTDLGPGPLQIGAYAVGGVVVVVADTQPGAGAVGEFLNGNDTRPHVYNTAAHVWAKAATSPDTITVTNGLASGAAPGGIGTDDSANTPAVPNVGAAFGPAGPYANYALVKTIAAGARNVIDVENTSGAQILLVLDDGTAAAGTLPANASLIPLAGGAAAGAQGGSWVSPYEKGRVQIYAAAPTAQVTVRVN